MGQQFNRYNVKTQVCSVDFLFPLVISTVQGTHAVVATFLIPARYTRKIWYKIYPPLNATRTIHLKYITAADTGIVGGDGGD